MAFLTGGKCCTSVPGNLRGFVTARVLQLFDQPLLEPRSVGRAGVEVDALQVGEDRKDWVSISVACNAPVSMASSAVHLDGDDVVDVS